MKKEKNVYLIDLKNDLIEKFKSADALNYCNIIKYVHLRYDFSAINLATLFDVNRATIYNYIDGKNDIPQKIQEMICTIYNVERYKEVSELEYRSNYYRAKLELMENKLIDEKLNDLDYAYLKINQTKEKIKYEIRENIEHKNAWFLALQKKQELAKLDKTDSFVSEMIKYMSRNSNSYNNRLLTLLSQSRSDDERLLMALNNYLSNETMEGNLGIVTTDIRNIKKIVDEIINIKNSLILLEEKDFKVFPKLHVVFKRRSFSSLHIILPKINFKTQTIILMLRSRLDVRLSIISEIINMIKSEYGKDINILFGAAINQELHNELIDIFFIE